MNLPETSKIALETAQSVEVAAKTTSASLSPLDWGVFIAFLVAMLALGWASKFLVRNTNDFFTGGGKIPWWLAGISHHVSGYSAVAFTAYAGIAYTMGFPLYVCWALPIAVACYIGMVLFAPRWSRLRTRYNIESPMEFLATRYDVPTQQVLAWFGVLLKIIDVGAKWAALALILNYFTGLDTVSAVLLSVGIGLFYSTLGGLWAGTLTDFAQFIVQFLAGIAMFVIALLKLNEALGTTGIEAIWKMWERLPEQSNRNFFSTQWDETFFIAMLFIFLLSFNGGTWNLAQRFIAAPTSRDAKKAAILTASLYLVWPLVLFFPMWAAPILLPDLGAGLAPEEAKKVLESSYCMMVTTLLPAGCVGLMVASLASHTLSMTTADATAITSVLSRDVIPRIWKKAASFDEKQSLLLARIVTFVFMLFTAVIALYSNSGIFQGIIDLVVGWFAPLVGVASIPMLLGLLPSFRRCGSFSVIASIAVGVLTFVLVKVYSLNTIAGGAYNGLYTLLPITTTFITYASFGLSNAFNKVPVKEEADEMLRALCSDGAPIVAGKPNAAMEVISDAETLRQKVRQLKRSGKRIGFVPTMGALHEGHLSLVRAAKQRCDVVLVSIFVNPTQFGPNEDFAKYPRDVPKDCERLRSEGVSLVFTPSVETMYPKDCETFIETGSVSEPLEGAHRPGHFRGVATVVLKLFHLSEADAAFFGEKDYQQLAVIKRMVEDLNVPIEIVPCSTVRERDGLAMSSRNNYLTPEERQEALVLSRALDRAEEMIVKENVRNSEAVREEMRNIILSVESAVIDYVSLADPATLRECDSLPQSDVHIVALLAVRIGSTRLIDNRVIIVR